MVNSYAIIFFLFSAECTKFNRQRQNRYVMLLKLNTVAIFFKKKKTTVILTLWHSTLKTTFRLHYMLDYTTLLFADLNFMK